MGLTILNTSIITGGEGLYRLKTITLADARELVSAEPFESAVGHQEIANLLTEVLGAPVPANRIEYKQGVRDTALVFKLNGRTPEGVILNQAQMETQGYQFYLLTREE
jgi:hypothetical protein